MAVPTLVPMYRLADFGVSEELGRYDAGDACSKSRGSPAFQPPEVAAGHESFSGFKVDAWAAGVTLFLCTSGRVPFEGSSLMHLFEQIAAVRAHASCTQCVPSVHTLC